MTINNKSSLNNDSVVENMDYAFKAIRHVKKNVFYSFTNPDKLKKILIIGENFSVNWIILMT